MTDAATPAPLTLRDLPSRIAAFGAAEAVVAFDDGGRQVWSFAELVEQARRLAAGLVEEGVAPGETVGLFAPSRPEWIVACLAIACTGAVVTPIDHQLASEDLQHVLSDCGCRRIFTTRDGLPLLQGSEVVPILLDTETGSDEAPSWRSLLRDGNVAPPAADPDDVAALFYTSGTTGRPKGVPLSHRNLGASIESFLGLDIVGPAQRVLVPLPFHHVYPFLVGLWGPLGIGAAVILPSGLSAKELGRALKEGAATVMIGVPRLYEALDAGIAARVDAAGAAAGVIFKMLLAIARSLRPVAGLAAGRVLFGRLHRALGPRLRMLVSGGARLDPILEQRLQALGWEVLTGYGLTETAAMSVYNPPGQARAGSAGRPAPGVEIRIVGGGPDQEGEIQIRGAGVFAGYRNRPDETAAAFTADGWLRTGDLGHIDADGYLYVTGRSKELIVLSGGENIAPDALEAVYGESPYMREIALLEHDRALVALVVPDLDALREFGAYRIEDTLRVSLSLLAQTLPAYQRISGYAITHAPLPRTRLGKLRRHLLPDLYARAAKGEAPAAEEMSPADREMLQATPVRTAWAWLQAQFPDRGLSMDTSPQLDLGLDSLAWIELVAGLEQELGTPLDEADVAGVVTLRDLLAAVAAAGAAAAPKAEAPSEVQIPPEDETWLKRPGPLLQAVGWVLHVIARGLARVMWRLEVEGVDNLPKSGPVVLASNHASFFDAPFLVAALPWRQLRRTWWAADRQQVFVRPWLRAFARIGHAFPVEDRRPAASLAKGARILARGDCVVWFPEAWRSPTGELQPFRPGIGRLLTETNAVAVPIHLSGTYAILPRDRRIPRLGRVRARIGAPRSADALDGRGEGPDRATRIANALHDAVAALAGGVAAPERRKPPD
ncbi:MAG: AMP-binding protein [Alphaproteobacteria bacterium]|nr:AMP-binding protein [Alphaproteobacteria bacterium]